MKEEIRLKSLKLEYFPTKKTLAEFIRSKEKFRTYANCNIMINFSRRVTILTGFNGTGKTTILRIIGDLLDWKFSIPDLLSSAIDRIGKHFSNEKPFVIGRICFSQKETNLQIKLENKITKYQISVSKPENIELFGVFYSTAFGAISNYRRSSLHRLSSIFLFLLTFLCVFIASKLWLSQSQPNPGAVESLGGFLTFVILVICMIAAAVFFQMGLNLWREMNGEHMDMSENYALKIVESINKKDIRKSLISNPLFLQSYNDCLAGVFNGIYENVSFTPETDEFVFKAKSGSKLSVHSSQISHGFSIITDLCIKLVRAKIQFENSKQKEKLFLVILDEPENHLHPRYQRLIVARIVEMFESAQFIIATQSPFIVNCYKDADIYSMYIDFDAEPPQYCARELLLPNSIKVPEEVYRDVFDLETTFPIWFSELLDKYYSCISGAPSDDRFSTCLELARKIMEAGGELFITKEHYNSIMNSRRGHGGSKC
ncbi:ATP-binding protein [bacterium]|nr:ATP-binding protein [bacterium]